MILASFLSMAAATTGLPNPQGQSAGTDDQKIICQMEIVTGSQIKQRTCRTKAQWKQISEDADKERENATSMPAASCDPSNPMGTCTSPH